MRDFAIDLETMTEHNIHKHYKEEMVQGFTGM